MILWTISLREIRSHRGRAILTAASIVIGVAAVVAVNLAAVAVRQSFGAMQATIAGEADLEVEAAGDILFDRSVAAEVAQVPGVESAAPVFKRPTIMYHGEGDRVTLILLGVDPEQDTLVRDYELTEGESLTAGDQVLMDAAFAEGLGLGAGDRIRLLASGGPRSFTVAGLLRPQTGAAVGSGGVLFMPLETAQRRLGRRDSINLVQVVLEENADPDAVQARIAEIVPEGATVRPTIAQSQMGEATMHSLQDGLRLATWFAVLAAVFIIANAFFMNVTQRQRQLAMLRAIGATRGQIRLLIFREAAILAIVGIVAGVAIGWGGAVLLSLAMERLFRTDLPAPTITPTIVAWAVGFGLGMSLLGTVFPARKAARVEPVEGMHEVSHADIEGVPRWFITLGVIGFIISAVLLAANLLGYLPGYDYVLGAIILLVFAVPVMPLALRWLAVAASFLARPMGRAEARLARQQLLRRQVRTVLTIGVLFVASSTGLGLASTVIDNINDVQSWYRRVMAGDFFLRAMTPDLVNWELAEVPAGVEEEARAAPGVEAVYGVRFLNGEVAVPTAEGEPEWRQVMITARDWPDLESVTADLAAISREEFLARIHAGQVTVGSVLAQRMGVEPGDTILIQTAQGPQERTIAAAINDYMGGGLVVHMERGLARELLGVQGADAFVIRAEEGRRDEAEAALRRIAEKHGLLFQSYAQLTREIDSMLAGVVGGLWVVMVLGLVVAALGVTNTLSMNVLEQTRELAMLRVVAMTRNQARRTIIAQAGMMGLIGLLPGVILGIGISWLMNRSLLGNIGREVAFGFHPWLGVGGFAVAMLLVLLAAWIPAQRAARLEPIQALRYE